LEASLLGDFQSLDACRGVCPALIRPDALQDLYQVLNRLAACPGENLPDVCWVWLLDANLASTVENWGG